MSTMLLSDRPHQTIDLVGSYCEIYWASTSRMAKRQCEKCVYIVRGQSNDMLCVELIYDAIEGEHRQDYIYWVPSSAVQYLKVISQARAQTRIETLEREVFEEMPRD